MSISKRIRNDQAGNLTRREFLHSTGSAVAIASGIAFAAVPVPAAANEAPIWVAIPDQSWTVGVSVFLDLSDYCSDPEGGGLSFSLSAPLPTGVTLNGGIISGTPQESTTAVDYVATADDSVVTPKSPTEVRAS